MLDKYCENCGALIGKMSEAAFEAMHRHCDYEFCRSFCAECRDEDENA